ncbi:MAG: XrtA/PEP-CTERM system amidotransferase [Gammaproteobacteria bacterium]
MCGIAGIFDTRGERDIDEALLARVTHSMTHRGPDEHGLYRRPGVGLGHRRLSIIDLASGQQPMSNVAGTVVVSFNGEIYNFRELRPELEAAGYAFRTNSDTEALLHAWEHWGERSVEHLRGMFAYAIWDARAGSLFLARDRLGVKPLYYALLDDGMLVFASELKGLMAHPGLARDIDPFAVEDYFGYGYVPEPRTIFRSARKLGPGETLLVRRGQAGAAQPRRYWDIPFAPVAAADEPAVCEELLVRLREAVRIRLVSEVPLGAFLSGGVDSSAVVAMMAGLQSDPVNTCSIAFDQKSFDETSYAEAVARKFGTNHHVERVVADDFSLIDSLAALFDEPFADSSALPTWRVCQLARQRVTVALSGDGGDENFGGYRRYKLHVREETLRSLLPLGLRRPLFGALGQVYPKADWAPRVLRAKTTFESLSRDTTAAYFHTVSIFNDALRARLFTPAFRRELQGYQAVEVLRGHARAAPTDDPLGFVQYLDMKTYLVGDILTKVDRASMAHALEVREPLLDHKLMEWASGLPSAFKLRGGEGKYILKKALESQLPHDILYRQKMGFAVPLAHWFRGPLRERVRSALLGERLAATGWFDRTMLLHLLDAHQSGRRDYSAPLWTLLMYESFLRHAGDAAAVPATAAA